MQAPPDSFGGPMAGPNSPPPSTGPGGPPPGVSGPGGPPPGAAAMDEQDRREKGELSLDELRNKVKRSRWNVFLYLAVAAIMFAFALIPLPVPAPWDDETVLSDSKNGGEIQQELPFLFGMPIDGTDGTDIRFILEVTPKDGGDFHTHVIEAHCNTDIVDNEMNEFSSMLVKGDKNWSDNHVLIEDASPGETYEIEFRLDPGGYCLVVEYSDYGHSTGSLEVTASVYGLREIGGGLGGLSLLWALFGFIGAQKNGKLLKERAHPRRSSISVEDQVIADTTQGAISPGPGGPPPAGPSAPPPTTPGPSAPPPSSPAPAAAPVAPASTTDAFAALGVPAAASVQPPTAALNYIESGDGYHYILKDDNTFDPQPYIKQADGSYVPFQT